MTSIFSKRCLVIKNLLKSEFPNDKFTTIENSPYGETIELCLKSGETDYRNQITITIDSEWNEIKKRVIDAKKYFLKISESDDKTLCQICFENSIKHVSCVGCGNTCCQNCFLEIMKNGLGLFTCSFCRHEIGEKVPEMFVDICLDVFKEIFKQSNDKVLEKIDQKP
jgi:hypothetical protein